MARKAGKATNYDDQPDFGMGSNKRRILDEYHTGLGTKLYVENGSLVEEKINSSYPFSSPPTYAPCLPQPRIDSPAFSQSAPRVKPPPPSYKAMGLAQNRATAEAALKYYNSKHRAKLSLVEPIRSNASLMDSGIWLHCNYTAKREGDEDSAARLFFAEMKVAKPECAEEYLVTICCPVHDDTKTSRKCGMCVHGYIVHPTGVSHQGLPQVERPLRPRRNGKVVSGST